MTTFDRMYFKRTWRKLRVRNDIENAYVVIRCTLAWEGYL